MIRITHILFLVLPLLAIAACSEERREPTNVRTIPEGAPTEEGWNMLIVLSDSSRTKAMVEAGHVRKYADKAETLIDSGLYVRFLDGEGRVTAVLQADSARIDDRTENMCAYGAVNVVSDENKTTVDSEILCYEKAADSLYSNVTVNVVDNRRGRKLRGDGFKSDMSLKNYTFYHASGSATDPDGK